MIVALRSYESRLKEVDEAQKANAMGKYRKGDHVKFEVVNEHSGESEWMWLLVETSDDTKQIVFGKLDSSPIVFTDMALGQELAVSFDNIRDHRRFE
jgi:uncharacterized protein YegJ (DUF2314 family)